MNTRYKRNSLKKTALKVLLIPLLIILSFFAISAGISIGNLIYDMDAGLIGKIETENFKVVMNESLPIINTIYNSGNIRVSVSGEIKSIIRAIFNFDLDTPLTILNQQSPLFLSYYNKEYKEQLALKDQPAAPEPTPSTVESTPAQEAPTQTPDVQSTPAPDDGPISSVAYEGEKEDVEKEKSDIVKQDKVEIHNYSSHKINLDELLKESFKINFDNKGPKVLIYQTHTSESYVLNEKDLGKMDLPVYNRNPQYNVVRVGDELTKNLKKYGIDVLHNGTVHDTNHPASYGASLKTLQKYIKSYPSLKVMFDIHRDAVNDKKLRVTTKVNGKTAAQIMFVVGTDSKNLPHPKWKENLKFAIRLQQVLNEKYPGLARPIFISNNRFNQHITNNSLIIEIGGDGNLLSECLESTKYLAEAIDIVINGK